MLVKDTRSMKISDPYDWNRYLQTLSKESHSSPVKRDVVTVIDERIVCAANRYVCASNRHNYIVLCGVRHGCDSMYNLADALENQFDDLIDGKCAEQGFITNKNRFVDRQEAWKIAVSNNQILRRVGGDDTDGGTLYSENLY